MDIVTRAEWGARAPTKGGFPLTSWSARTGFVVHYSAANKFQTVRAIQNYQMDTRGWRDIGYNFLVDYRGIAYEGCRGTWLAIGAHVANHNTANLGVCAIGTDADITVAQMDTIRRLYDEACDRANKTLSRRIHRGISGASTECPGDRLARWVGLGMPLSTPPPNPVPEPRRVLDMFFLKVDGDEAMWVSNGLERRALPAGTYSAMVRPLEAEGVPRLTLDSHEQLDAVGGPLVQDA